MSFQVPACSGIMVLIVPPDTISCGRLPGWGVEGSRLEFLDVGSIRISCLFCWVLRFWVEHLNRRHRLRCQGVSHQGS